MKTTKLTSCHLKEDDSKYGRLESSDLPKISEYLSDTNILNSKRTYGKKENNQRLSMYRKNNEPTFVKVCLYVEENCEPATYVTGSSYYKNKNQKDINSKFSLYNDDDFQYYFFDPADSEKQRCSDESKSTNNDLNLNQATFSDVFEKVDGKILSKTVQKKHTSFIDDVNIIDSINNVGALRKGGSKTPLKTVKKRNNECVYNTKRKNKVRKNCVLKKRKRNKSRIKMKCRSSSSHGTAEKIQSNHTDKQIEKPSLTLCNENAVQNPAYNNNYNIVDPKFLPIIPLYKLPLFPTCQEPACKAIRSAAGNCSIQNDNHAVSMRNSEDIVIAGLFILSRNYSSSEFDMEDVLTSNSNNTDVTNCSNELESEDGDKPVMSYSTSFDIRMAHYFSINRNNRIVDYREYFEEILFSTTGIYPPGQKRDMTLIEFCSFETVRLIFGEILKKHGLNSDDDDKATLSCSAEYNFPKNFEKQIVTALITDYVLFYCQYFIPENPKVDSIVPYVDIINPAVDHMCNFEYMFVLTEFQYGHNGDGTFPARYVLAKLGHIALFVMYSECVRRQKLCFKNRKPF